MPAASNGARRPVGVRVTQRAYPLPKGARPHDVAPAPDGAVWCTAQYEGALVRFDPETEQFDVFPSARSGANVRQMLGRAGEVWAPESGTDHLVVYRSSGPGKTRSVRPSSR